MGTNYDVIVIGAGLGGLSAAVSLAHSGFKVLLVEKHNIPGGYATSFCRGRFEFEVALHELSDIGPDYNRGFLYRFLERVGVAKKVEFIQTPELYRSVFPGLDITLPMGRDAYEDALTDAFPHEAKGIHRFLDRIFKLAEEADELNRVMKGAPFLEMMGKAGFLPFKLRSIPRYFFQSWEDVLARDVEDEAARAVISQYWGYFGLSPSRVSFLYFAIGLRSYIHHGAAQIKGRSQSLANAFVESIEENGGDVLFNTPVEKIIVENEKATGVIAGEKSYQARYVISNADPITTARSLVGIEHFPDSYFKNLRPQKLAAGTVNVYMGCAKPLNAFGIDNHEIFLQEDFDMERHYAQMHHVGTPSAMALTCYNASNPEISPEGTSINVLTALQYGQPWAKIPPEEYVETKNEIADAMIASAEQIMPGLRASIEAVEVSTPVTNMRYTGAIGGSIYGFFNAPYNHTVLRHGFSAPIGNLAYTGAFIQPGGGYSPAMLSGQMAGGLVKAKLRKRG